MRKQIRIGACAALAIAAATSYLHFENTALQTTNYSIVSEKLPQAFDGYKIAQISDFHNSGSVALGRRLRKAVQKAQPDRIVITGDLIDRRRTDVDTAIRLVHDLKAFAPICFVCGNHDAQSEEYGVLVSRLRAEGVQVLENETIRPQRGADSIVIAGIDDLTKTRAWHEGVGDYAIVRMEIERLALDPQDFNVLLSHRPEAFYVYASQGPDVVFTGHAHGGQARLPLIGGLFAPSQGVLPKYTSGVHTQGQTQMVISRGVGNSAFPFRVFNRPELVVVTLERKEEIR